MSRRRKSPAGRNKPHQHSATCSCEPAPQCPQCWPTGRQITDVLELGPVAAEALAQLTADDVLELLQRIPGNFRQLMMRQIGLMSASRINRGMAGQLLARMRNEPDPARSDLLSMLTQPVTNLLDTDLTVGEWTAFIGPDPAAAARVLLDHAPILDLTLIALGRMNPLLRTAGLASAIADNSPGAIVALALLAGQDPRCAAAHARLSEQFPQMPPVCTVPLGELTPSARFRAAVPSELVQEVTAALGDGEQDAAVLKEILERHRDALEAVLPARAEDASGEDPDADLNEDPDELAVALDDVDADIAAIHAALEQDFEPDDQPARWGALGNIDRIVEMLLGDINDPVEPRPDGAELRTSLVRLIQTFITATLDDWQDVAETAETLTASLQQGRIWTGDQLEVLAKYETAVATVARAAGLLLGRDIPSTVDALTAAVAELNSELAQRWWWLHALVELDAPVPVAAAAEAARRLAQRAIDPTLPVAADDDDVDLEALQALHTIVTAGMRMRAGGGTDTVDYDALAEADHLVREMLPSVVPLLVPAGYGAVTVPDRTPAAPATTDAPAAPTATDDTAADSPAAAVATADTDDTSGADAPQTVTADTSDTDSHDTHDHDTKLDSSTDPSPTATPATAPATGRTDHDEADNEVDDEAALAALLAGGAARTLSNLTGAKPRPTTSNNSADDRNDASAKATTPSTTDRSSSTDGQRRTPAVAAVPTQKSTEPALNDTTDKLHDQAARTHAKLLADGRFGLSADLLDACGNPTATVAARRGVAYATALRHPTGGLASAFSRVSTNLTRDGLSDDRAGQLLAWACAARLAVLAPSAGPAAILTNLAPVIEHSEALTEVGHALTEASRSGVVVLPGTAQAVGSLAASEQSAQTYAEEARDLVVSAPTRAIKYMPANAVYQSWMHTDGVLGGLLRTVAAGDPTAVADVRDQIVQMRGGADKAIGTTRTEVRRKHHKDSKIVAGPRATLIVRYDDAIELASNWAQAVERAADTSSKLRSGAWRATPLTKLRQRLAAVRHNALTDLAGMHQSATANPDDPAQQEINAAAAVATALLNETFSICDGNAPIGEEAAAHYVAHHELLATDLALTSPTLLPDNGLAEHALPALLILAATAPADPDTIYTHRASRGDHDLTATFIAGVRATDPRTAQALDRRRTADVAADLAATTAQIDALISSIDTQRMAGGLDDGPYSALSATAEALRPTKRNDFGRIRTDAQQIRTELATHLRTKSEQAIARINERAGDDETVAAIADKLIDLANEGYVASAEEFLAQRQVPTAKDNVDHLEQFFPAVPDLYATHPDLHTELAQALSTAAPTPSVTALAALAGTEFSALSELRIDAGQRALRAFSALQSGGKPKIDIGGLLRPILTQAGLEFTDATLDTSTGRQPGGRQWITLSSVAGTGDALVPLLGSAMSPAGNSLRVLIVRQAQSPATVLEWMSTEPPDRTVLALWTGKPLSAADRRKLADAARGRPTPPVLWLDTAVLGYLTCQSEPRRSTFAATALPLTAVSPFRDKAGAAPVEMFYGRTEEIAEVLDLQGPSIVYGGRQLGKSALLRSAAERFEQRGPDRVAVLESIFTVGSEDTDRDPSRLWDMLWPRLAARRIVPETVPTDVDLAEAVHDHIVAWTSQPDTDRVLLVLLDEADVFLDADAAHNRFAHVDWCRRITADSHWRAKFVFAGLHRTARFESLPNQPLSHLGRPISIGPLKPQHAYDLLTEPLRAMGFRFADTVAGPARVLALANNMPALLQLFGRALIEHLAARPVDTDGPPSLIGDEDIDAVFNNPDLRKQFEDKYQLTLRLDHRYMVIAYVVAEAAYDHGIATSMSLTELLAACRAAWPAGFAEMSTDDFRGLVAECADLSVLAQDDGRFRIRTPTVLRLLGTEEHVLDVLYNRTEDLRVPSATDASSYRRTLSAGGARSPFTERQLGQLFTPANRVVVVTGTAALGAQRAATALEEVRDATGNRIDSFRRCSTLTADGIRRTLGQLSGKSAILLVDALKTTPAALRELLTTAENEIARTAARRNTTVVVIVGGHNAPVWVDWPHRLELLRVDGPGLRLWSDEVNLPFHDDHAIARLRTATGGWPQVINHLVGKFADKQGPTEEQVLSEATRWLAGPVGARDLATHAELSDGILAAAFTSIATLTAKRGEDLDFLAEVIEMDGLNPAQAVAAGYSDLTDVVITLRALGCLVSDTQGWLSAEPILAAAVQAHAVARTGAGAE